MPYLKFKAEDVLPLVTHASESTSWTRCYSDQAGTAPALFLVGDEGVYLMSNGLPRLTRPGEDEGLVAYAEGINPKTDEDWYDAKGFTFGYNDGADELVVVGAILNQIVNHKVSHIVFRITSAEIELMGVEEQQAMGLTQA